MTTIDISYRNIARITAPVLVTQLSYTAMGVIDTIMVGQLGVLYLGAVGLGNMLTWWFLSFFFGTLTGVNTFVAQAYGASDRRRVGVVFWQGLYLALGSALLIALSAPWVSVVFGWTDATPEMQAIAVSYSQIRLFGALGLTLLVVADNFYRGLGRTDIPMWCALGQLVLNCGLNYLLIFGKLGLPRLEVRGAALGTIIAQSVVGTVLVISVLRSRRIVSRYYIVEAWRPRLRILRRMLGVSLPIGIQTFMEMGGVSVFTAVVARLGEVQMAATNAVIQAWSLAFMIAFALSVGATTLVGQCLGASQLADARRSVSRIMKIGLGLMGATAVLYIGLPEQLIGLFVRGEDVAALVPYARPLFLVVVIALVFDLRFNIVSGALRGAGDTTYSMLANIGSAWLVFVPLVLWVTPRFGLVGAWWCFVVHVALMTVLLELRYRGSRWIHVLTEADATGESSARAGLERKPA